MKVTLPIIDPELRVIIKTLAANLTSGILDGTKIANLQVSNLVAGTITSKSITLAVEDGDGDSKIQAGKTDFTNTDAGFILGLDDSDSNKAKLYIGNSSIYLNWTGLELIISGGTIKATGGSTNDVWLNSDSGNLEFYYGEVKKATIGVNSTFDLLYQAATSHQFFDNENNQLAVFKDSVTQNLQLIKGGISFSVGGTKLGWSTGRYILEDASQFKVNGDWVPSSDEGNSCGSRGSNKWNEVVANRFYQQDSNDGNSAHVYDFAYIEMGLVDKKLINKWKTDRDGKKFQRVDGRPDRDDVRLPFKIGSVLKWTEKGLKESTNENDFSIAIASDRGMPIVLGAEPVRIIGKAKIGDYIVASNKKGCAMAIDFKYSQGKEVIGRCLENKNLNKEKLIKVMIKF